MYNRDLNGRDVSSRNVVKIVKRSDHGRGNGCSFGSRSYHSSNSKFETASKASPMEAQKLLRGGERIIVMTYRLGDDGPSATRVSTVLRRSLEYSS